jgi:hypothetical protein
LGKDELSAVIKNEEDFIENELIKAYVSLFKEGEAKVFFLGIGIDPLTTKPEILTSIVLNGSTASNKLINLRFKNNYEGEDFMVPFTEEGISKYIQDENTLPAGIACLLLIEKQYDFIMNLFQ